MSLKHFGVSAGLVSLFVAATSLAQQAVAQGDESRNSQASAQASVPRLVKFSGVVKDRRGEALTAGVVTLSFAIYDAQEGGTALWAEKQAVELDEQGRYTVLLGATHSAGLSLELFPSGQARWLGVAVEGGEEQARVLLVSVPYALKAEEAEMLGGKRASDFVLAEKLKEEVKTAVAVEVQQVGEKSSEQVASEKGPQPLTGAEGPTDFTGSNSTQIVSATQTGTGKAIYALIQNAASGAQAVRGETNATAGRGVFGYATATTGTAIGVRGQSDSPTGIGVAGYLSATTGYNYALSGISASAQGRGVLAQATSTTGTTIGFLAQVSSPSGVGGTFRNTASGKIITGEVGAGPVTQVFSVDGSGNIVGAGTHTGTRLISTVSTGTAPLTVASTTAVANLNADMVDSLHAASFALLASPNTFAATQTISSGDVSITSGNLSLPDPGTGGGVVNLGGARFIHNYPTIASQNVFVGQDAGNLSVSGNKNTALGYQAQYHLTSGSSNTAVGNEALIANTTGIRNVAVGDGALINDCNGSVGACSGQYNTAVGYGALGQITTGGHNLGIGDNAGFYATTGDYDIYIGNNGVAAEANTIRVGVPNTQTKAFIAGIRGVTTDNANAVSVLIDSAGQLGTASSSRRVKEDIQDMGAASRPLLRLRPVVFRYRQASADGSKPLQYGLIAEEVAAVLPELAANGSDGQVETVKYHVLPVLLLNELQRQEKELADSRAEISELRKALAEQAADLRELKAAVRRSATPASK